MGTFKMVDKNFTRNARIWNAYRNNVPVRVIAKDFNLSESQIRRVVDKVLNSKGRTMLLYETLPALDALFGSDYAKQEAG